jgi:hypothetical protein
LVKVKQRYIKSENRKWLIGYLLVNIVIFALFSNLINFNLIDTNQLISKFKDPQGFIPLSSAILIIVLEGLFKNSLKEFFVFWRFKNRLPGHRAFSHIGPNDPRIDMERVRKLFPHGIPTDPKVQNSEWFQLYSLYQDELQVFYSHKAFLLTRDLTSLTVVFIPLSILGHFLLGSKPQMLVYHLLILVILFIAISLSAKHYGERFVANVIVEASIKKL